MKKTVFKDIELLLSTTYDKTYMDILKADGISYSSRTIPIFQALLPLDTLSYGGYELTFVDESGKERYVYPFITEKKDFTKCITFFPDNKLDNLYLLDLEQALRTGQLVFDYVDADSRIFKGFDFSKDMDLELLLDKVIELEDGSSYEFTTTREFPEGLYGKKILSNGDAVNVFLTKTKGDDLFFVINEAGSGCQLLDKEKIASIFGTK